MKNFITTAICILIHFLAQAQSKVYNINIDVNSGKDTLKPIWAFFGYDEPNYTYMKDGRKLLAELSALSPVAVFVRTHNMLTTGDGTAHLKWGSTNAYTEDANGSAVYDWHIADSVFDTYIRNGMKPIAEIGFMPKALSTQPEPYEHHWTPAIEYKKIYTGWAFPPKDYRKWAELVFQWVTHCVKRYGEEQVRSWWWEVWNEPDIGYWQGTREEYFKLYDFAADAVKRACPQARIGGPTSTSPRFPNANAFLTTFLQHCDTGVNYATGKTGSPLDYISFHAKGSPVFMNGYVRMNMAVQLQDIDKGFQAIAASRFKNLPVIIGENDPEGCAACSVNFNPQNAYRNGTMYSGYTAASYARIYDIARKNGTNIEGAVSWSFEFEDQPWFAGFRDLATNGVDKPVLNVFRLFAKMKGRQLTVQNEQALTLGHLMMKGVHDSLSDVQALATAGKRAAYILLWNYYDDDLPAPDASINLTLRSVPARKVRVNQYSIDSANSNSYTAWKKMGSPQQVTTEQYADLEKAGKLQLVSQQNNMAVKKGVISIGLSLPRQAVSLVEVVW